MNTIHCFAIKRGESRQRFDPHFHHPLFTVLVNKIKRNKFSQLGDIINQSSETWDKSSDLYIDTFPYIEISEVGLGTNQYHTNKILVAEAPSRAKQIVRVNDIIVSLTRPHRGAIAKIKTVDNQAIASTGFAVLRELKQKDFDKDFLLNVLFSDLCLLQFLQRSSGGNYPAITSDQLEKVILPRIDTDIQIKLVGELENSRTMRLNKLNQAEELLKGLDEYFINKLDFTLPTKADVKSYAISKSFITSRIDSYSNQSHFRKLLSQLSEKKYNTHLMKSISSRIISGSTPLSGGDAYTDPPAGIRFIRSGEITSDGSVTPKSENHIKEEIHQNSLQRSQLKKNDVLIAIVGATIGQVGVYEYDDEANINQAIAAVSVNERVLPHYLCWYLKSSLGQMILDYYKRPVARANINLEEIAQIPVIIPSLEIQKEIIDEVFNKKEEANKLKADAENIWLNAKKWFEDQLLEGAK